MGKVKEQARSHFSNNDFQAGASGGITSENYNDRCVAFIKGRGGEGFVIRAMQGENGALAAKKPATWPQWLAWMEYFARKGMPNRYARYSGMTTVPCEWPEDFDYEAPVSDRFVSPPPPPPPISDDRRAVLADRMRKVGWQLSAKPLRSPTYDPYAEPPKTPEQHLAELKHRFTTTPCAPLSKRDAHHVD